MNGRVMGLQARMGVVLYAPSGIGLEIECVVDTGFEGFLTLPVEVVEKLKLTYLGPMNANLADNSRITNQVYQAKILWKDGERVIPILAMGNRPLLGTALLEDCHLGIDFYEGGTVLVDEII